MNVGSEEHLRGMGYSSGEFLGEFGDLGRPRWI